MHIKIPKFLSVEECKLIEKTLLEKEQEILNLPANTDYYSGTTARYEHYNFLKFVPEIDITSKFFDLAIMQDENEFWIQCWGNVLNKGDAIKIHSHGPPNSIFYAANIFISGPDDCFTYYDDTLVYTIYNNNSNNRATYKKTGSNAPELISNITNNCCFTPRLFNKFD